MFTKPSEKAYESFCSLYRELEKWGLCSQTYSTVLETSLFDIHRPNGTRIQFDFSMLELRLKAYFRGYPMIAFRLLLERFDDFFQGKFLEQMVVLSSSKKSDLHSYFERDVIRTTDTWHTENLLKRLCAKQESIVNSQRVPEVLIQRAAWNHSGVRGKPEIKRIQSFELAHDHILNVNQSSVEFFSGRNSANVSLTSTSTSTPDLFLPFGFKSDDPRVEALENLVIDLVDLYGKDS